MPHHEQWIDVAGAQLLLAALALLLLLAIEEWFHNRKRKRWEDRWKNHDKK